MPVVPQPFPGSGQNPLVPPPPGSGVIPTLVASGGSPLDLTTIQYVTQVLLAGGVTLNVSQSAICPSLITAASREIIRYCNRKFALDTYTEIVIPEGGRQDRGEPASAKLSAFPIVKTMSVMTCRSTVLTVTNRDASTNQFAQVGFAITGDVEYLDLTYTGLELTRMASGVSSTVIVSFASNLTLASLATTINGLGNGWSASVEGNYAPWPSASLVGVREPKDALSQGACLELFTKPARSYEITPSTGIMRCSGWDWNGGFGFGGGGWDQSPGFGYGGVLGASSYRVTYQAGWATIPANLQQICAEVVKGMYARLSLDPNLKSETADKYSWAARDTLETLPDWATSALDRYKDWTV